jgi:hypothetical protein
MPSYSGVWNLPAQMQAVGAGNWTNTTTRGLFGGGYSNVINAISLTSVGNATDFGDMLSANAVGNGGCASGTRGVFGGGLKGNAAANVIQYVTIATNGNATDFGDLTIGREGVGACSNSTKGVFAGGDSSSGRLNTIDYIVIASTGNATDLWRFNCW